MQEWLEKLRAEYDSKKLGGKVVVALGLLGMGLIVCSELCASPSTTADSASAALAVDAQITSESASDEQAYRAQLEESLAALISQLDGAGNTVVMVSLVSGEEVVYAQDVTTSDSQSSQSHVLLSDGSALAQTVLSPTVYGVVVLCEGGDNVVVEANITAMVTALFDISSNHVSVEKLG